MFKRSFTSDSWWNTPFPASAAVDPNSAVMIRAQALFCPPPTVGTPTGAWAMPWSEANALSHPATIRDASGDTVTLAVDTHVGEMVGNDAAVVWRDLHKGVEVATFETVVPRKSDGTINLTRDITCTNFSVYYTGTNGLAQQVGGDKRNTGHRGVTPSSMALYPLECVVPIRSVKKVSLGPPADYPGPNHPMYGIESPRKGGIPEGARLRLRNPAPGNIVQQAAHEYGFIVGDTAGDGHATLKTVQGGGYAPAILTALDGLTWNDWDVMTLGK